MAIALARQHFTILDASAQAINVPVKLLLDTLDWNGWKGSKMAASPDGTVTFIDIATLVIACFGAVMAVLSLGWQIAAWALEGRRVRVVLKHGAIGRGGIVAGSVDGSGKPRDLRSHREQGFTGPEVLGITATNMGRAPVTISRYSATLIGGRLSFTPAGDQIIGPDLPFRLQPGESESWYVEMNTVHAVVDAAAAVDKASSRGVAMTVELGTGDTKKTRHHIRV